MSNIIDINNEPGWENSEYGDTSVEEGKIHQHRVKAAHYVSLPRQDTLIKTAKSETSYIGAYEYAPGGWITDHTHADAEQWYYVLSGQGVMKVGSEEAKRRSRLKATSFSYPETRYTPTKWWEMIH